MIRTGIKLDLDVNDFVNNAGRAQSSLAALTDAMKKANQKGNMEEAGMIAYEIDRLEKRNFAFDFDVQKTIGNPNFQPHSPTGKDSAKTDPAYIEAVKGQVEAMNRLSTEFNKAIEGGDISKARGISTQLDRKQDDIFKAIKGYSTEPKQGDLFPPKQGDLFSQMPDLHEAQEDTGIRGTDPLRPQKRPEAFPLPERIEAIKNQNESFPETVRGGDTSPITEARGGYNRQFPNIAGILGDYMTSKESVDSYIKELEAQITKQKPIGGQRLGELYYTQNSLKNTSYAMGANIESLSSNKQIQQIAGKQINGQPFTESEAKIAEKFIPMIESIKDSTKKTSERLGEAIRTGDTGEMMRQAPEAEAQATNFRRTVEQGSTPTGMKGLEAGIKAIGISQIAGAINEGFSRYANSLDRSGIVAQYGSGDIMGAQLAEKRREADLNGGMAQAGGSLAGSIIGGIIGSLAGPGGIAAGAMIGGSIGSAGGSFANTAFHFPIGKEATDISKAEQWQQRSAASMELAALMGDPKKIREAFDIAADAAAHFGYSAEEGMEAMRQAARQGLDVDEARRETENIFEYERSTGADRGALSSVAHLSSRYGNGDDGLRATWAGLHASGMKTSQYDEYLRATQRTMEEGVSKGIYRSAEDVAINNAMFGQLTGNSPMWKGENAGRRLSEMNAGLEGATSLSTTSDIMAYRAARSLVPEGSSYIEAMKVMEGGLTPELFTKFMEMTSNAEGGGREGIVERMRQTFGLNYTNADALYQGWMENPDMNRESLNALISPYMKQGLPDTKSPELDAFKSIQETTNLYTRVNQTYWDKMLPDTLGKELDKATKELIAAMHGGKGVDTIGMTPADALAVRQEEFDTITQTGNKEAMMGAAVNLSAAEIAMVKANREDMAYKDSLYSDYEKMSKDFFSPGFSLNPFRSREQKADEQAELQIRGTLGRAIESTEPLERQAGEDFINMFRSVPEETRKQWDSDNSINSLAVSTGIEHMISLLEKLIDATREDRKVNINFSEY